MHTASRFIMGILGFLIIGLGLLVWSGSQERDTASELQATTTPETAIPATSETKIALLDTSGQGNGKKRGCDAVVMVARPIAATTTPLTAAMQALFAEGEGAVGGKEYNFIARTKNTLAFERATVKNGTAKIYLTGNLSGLAGVCDDPRAQIQIEETALQFPTVERVEIYLNGARNNLTPSQQG